MPHDHLTAIVRSVLLAEGDDKTAKDPKDEEKPTFVQSSKNGPALKYDGIPGIRSYEKRLTATQRDSLRVLLNLRTVQNFTQYDDDILAAASAANVNPALLKALGLLESSLGERMTVPSDDGTARGFIHMTMGTYTDFAKKMGIPTQGLDSLMEDPRRSLPICAAYLRYLVDKFRTPDRVAFSVKNGEYKIGKIGDEAKKSKQDAAKKVGSALSNSDYTQIALVLREMFGPTGAIPVGTEL